jgi:hypothetical protein
VLQRNAKRWGALPPLRGGRAFRYNLLPQRPSRLSARPVSRKSISASIPSANIVRSQINNREVEEVKEVKMSNEEK